MVPLQFKCIAPGRIESTAESTRRVGGNAIYRSLMEPFSLFTRRIGNSRDCHFLSHFTSLPFSTDGRPYRYESRCETGRTVRAQSWIESAIDVIEFRADLPVACVAVLVVTAASILRRPTSAGSGLKTLQ